MLDEHCMNHTFESCRQYLASSIKRARGRHVLLAAERTENHGQYD